MQHSGYASNLRALRMDDWLWNATKAKASESGVTASGIIRDLLMAWLSEGARMEPEQLAIIAITPRGGRPGQWEKLAARRIRELGKAGYLTVETAGYADALRIAGRNLDHAESNDGTTAARVSAGQAWERALGRIVAPPIDSQRDTEADPWKVLADDLRNALPSD